MKDTGCQYHPSCLTCPEPMCIMEYPGGPQAYFGYKELVEALDKGLDMNQASQELSATRQSLRRRLNKGALVSGNFPSKY